MPNKYITTILICFLMNMLDGMDVMIMSYAAPNISKAWSLSPTIIGYILSAGLLGMTIGAIFLAPLADSMGRKKLIILSNIIMSLGVLSTAWAPNLPMLFMLRIISGVGIGCMLACTATLTAENAPKASKEFWVSFVMSGYAIGAVLSGIVASRIIPDNGWPIIFKFAGAVTLATLPIIYFLLPESISYNDKSKKTLILPVSELLSADLKHSTIPLWIGIFLAFASLYFLTLWIPKLASAAGMSEALAINAGVMFNLGAFCGIVTQGIFSRHFGLEKTICIFLIITAIVMAVFGYFKGSDVTFWLFGLIGFGIQGGFVGMYSLAAKIYDTDIRATGVGWTMGIGRVGAIFGPILAGYFTQNGVGMSTNFVIFAIPTLIAGLAMLRIPISSKI